MHYVRVSFDVPAVLVREVAEQLIGGPFGHHDDVAGLSAARGHLIQPVDESEHDGQQTDDEDKGQGGQQGGGPAHQQVAQVIADWHASQSQQRQEQQAEERQRPQQ